MVYFVLTMLALASCQGAREAKQENSQLSYISWGLGSSQRATLPHVHSDQVKICLTGQIAQEQRLRVVHWAGQSTLTWLRTVKVLDERVTSRLSFDCEEPHLTIRLRNGSGTSYASPGVTTIYSARPFGTWTHELGHAFSALGDTYGGGAGSCRSGQPQSLMCWGAYGPKRDPEQFSTLWEDDIQGVQANYALLFTDEYWAPDWAPEMDLQAPLDIGSPWPGAEPFVPEDWLSQKFHELAVSEIFESGLSVDL